MKIACHVEDILKISKFSIVKEGKRRRKNSRELIETERGTRKRQISQISAANQAN